MKIVVAADSFKDALPALDVCKAIGRGIQNYDDQIEVILFPLADGGEGTASILSWHSQGQWIDVKTRDPLFRWIDAAYGWKEESQTAFIEMAQASGLQLLQSEERNCLHTSTIGTGDLILDAVNRGAKQLILGIGGSATNDVGIGMADTLGYHFLNAKKEKLSPVGKNLIHINSIEDAEAIDLSAVKFSVLTDVDNPLYGPLGAAKIYAGQKGADNEAVQLLEQGAQHFSALLESKFGKDFSTIEGAGAAGGLGAGAMAFLNAELFKGIDFIMDFTNFEKTLKGANLVITGEGKMDAQTLHGKLIYGITQRSKKYGIPVIAFCGTLQASPQQIKAIGLEHAFQISDSTLSLELALKNTAENLERKVFQVISKYIF